MVHHISAQQKCTIPSLAPPALLVTCQQAGVSSVSVMEWPVGEMLNPSKYISHFILKKVKHSLSINILVRDPV